MPCNDQKNRPRRIARSSSSARLKPRLRPRAAFLRFRSRHRWTAPSRSRRVSASAPLSVDSVVVVPGTATPWKEGVAGATEVISLSFDEVQFVTCPPKRRTCVTKRRTRSVDQRPTRLVVTPETPSPGRKDPTGAACASCAAVSVRDGEVAGAVAEVARGGADDREEREGAVRKAQAVCPGRVPAQLDLGEQLVAAGRVAVDRHRRAALVRADPALEGDRRTYPCVVLRRREADRHPHEGAGGVHHCRIVQRAGGA